MHVLILPVLIALAPAGGDAEPTYSRDVAPILQAKCQGCHRPGQIGPFALMDYGDAKRWRESIAEVVDDGRMPPWHADPEIGHFANDRSLSADERATLLKWVEADAPEGDPADLPPPRQYAEGGWEIGTPDVVFQIPRTVKVKATGIVDYMYFRVPTEFTEDKWVAAMEIRPDNRRVVHHILVFVVGPDGRMVPGGGARGGQLASYAPGDDPARFPEGLGKKIAAGSSLVFQVHYTPIGKEVEDRSSFALKFADAPPEREVKTLGIPQPAIQIPPGEANYRAEQSWVVPQDVRVLSLWPHMHLRGKSFTFTAKYPDGREEVLLSVPRYDFNWQTSYTLAEPKVLPKGTRIICVAHYDNSAGNPALTEDDIKKTIRWGDQTHDEMLIGYLDYVAVDPASADDEAEAPRPVAGGNGGDPLERIKAAFERFDTDKDGVLKADDLPFPQVFERLDLDGDGKLTREEAEKAVQKLRGDQNP